MREGGLLRYELFVFFRHFLGSEPGHVNVKGRVKNGHEGRKVQDERPRCVIHIRDAEHTHGEEGIGGPGHKGAAERSGVFNDAGAVFGAVAAFAEQGSHDGTVHDDAEVGGGRQHKRPVADEQHGGHAGATEPR